MPSKTYTQLIEGYHQFCQRDVQQKNQFQTLVTDGQKPKVLFITCSDSRVDPAIVTHSHPGDLFVVRNVANLVPAHSDNPQNHSTSAAIEFAVTGLGVEHIIVMGHSHCGGINALMSKQDDQLNSYVDHWMTLAAPVKKTVNQQYGNETLATQCTHAEKASVLHSLENLTTFPWVQERLANQTLHLHGWYFDLAKQSIQSYDKAQQHFLDL